MNLIVICILAVNAGLFFSAYMLLLYGVCWVVNVMVLQMSIVVTYVLEFKPHPQNAHIRGNFKAGYQTHSGLLERKHKVSYHSCSNLWTVLIIGAQHF